MKYTGLNPTDVNKVASGSLGVFVESTQVGTFGINSLVVSGSTTLSGSLTSIGPQVQSGSLTAVGNTTITGSLTVVTGSSIELQVTNIGVKIGNASGDFHTVTGSLGTTGSVNIQGNTGINGTLSVTGSQYTSGSTDVNTIQGSTAGGTLLNVLGTAGQLFTVTDGLSGSLFSVNTISGLPVLEAFSDFSFVAGPYGVNNLFVGNSRVGIMTGTPTATLDVVGNTRITGSTVITGSLSIPTAGDASLLTIGSAASPFFLVTGSTGRVSVNTTSSVSSLNVGGTTNVLTVQGTTVEGNMFDVYGPAGQLFSVVDGLSGSLFSVNTISGVPVMEVFSDNTVRIGQYSNPPLIVTGATASVSGSLNVNSGNINVTSGSITIFKSGSSLSDSLFDVEGAQGQLFSVIDSFSGSLMSVNDISGFPILDVRSDDTITMGTYGSNALLVSQSAVVVGVTASSMPLYTGRDGEFRFGVSGSSYVMYVYLAGKWRSGSLSN
jgi:hypothetical protein